MGIVYTVIWCAQTSPHQLSPILRTLPHRPAAMVIRTGGIVGKPPPPVTHTRFQQLEATALDL